MRCLVKWLGTPTSKQQCPMDRRPWSTSSTSFSPEFLCCRRHAQSPPTERKVSNSNTRNKTL
ncbi:hypothetical protein EDD15DRAFT_2270635 [Pisolithus albus]|nr:hypothetical protein EDD15DRAFT_2270635 [Pisolithus albus]